MSKTLTIKDLEKFKAVADSREYMNSGMIFGDGAAFTNGHVLAVLDGAASSLPAGAKNQAEFLPRAASLRQTWEAVPADGWKPVSSLVRPVNESKCVCDRCESQGFVRVNKCEDCEGEGEFEHCNHKYVCKGCDGHGEIVHPARPSAKGAVRCIACQGDGYIYDDYPTAMMPGVERAGIHLRYADWIAALPECQWAMPKTDPDGSCGSIPFKFKGGWGVVMPFRTR